MPVESLSSPSGGWSSVQEALAEIRACPDELQGFLTSVFERLSELTDQLLAHEVTCQQTQRHDEQDALQSQIDGLAATVAELARAVTEQQRWGHADAK